MGQGYNLAGATTLNIDRGTAKPREAVLDPLFMLQRQHFTRVELDGHNLAVAI